MFSMSSTPIEVAPLKKELQHPGAGACVTFEGWVRNENEGKDVQSLEYEGYEAVAAKEGEKLIEETIAKYGIAWVTWNSERWPCGWA